MNAVMANTTLTLSGETAADLERFAAEGGYASPEAALAALLKQQKVPGDPDLERWLNECGGARYDALQADPSRAMSVADARAMLLKDT
jgi:hypothetical protein